MNELLRRLLFLPPQASTMAYSIDRLHFWVIGSTMAGATGVALVIGWFLIKYRRKAGGSDLTERVQAPVWLEASFIVGTFGLFVTFWFVGFLQYVELSTPPADAMDVYVTGKQWMWTFNYPDGRATHSFLYVPAGRPVRLLMTSRDVIHSFYVPDFRIKQDVVPGRTTATWFEAKERGAHDIFCAEMCGVGHSTMRGRVVVLGGEDWDRWARGEYRPLSAEPDELPALVGGYDRPQEISLAAEGERIAGVKGCFRCHTPDGTPHLGPSWYGLYHSTRRLTDGKTVFADEAYLTESMMDPQAKLVAGFQNIMPSYQGFLEPAETAALVEYIKSLGHAP